jgi:hypothetical protein
MKIEQQIKRVENLISRIDAGGYVSRPCLKKAIGEVGLQVLDSRWAEEKRTRGRKPNEIVEYSNRLRRGLQLYSIGRRASYKYNHQKAEVAWGKARASLYSALEYLECAIASKPGLRLWIDRDPIESDLCPEGVPRPIWSMNALFNNSDFFRISKRELTQNLLVEALSRLNAEIGNPEKIDVNFSLRFSRRTYVEADFSGFKF